MACTDMFPDREQLPCTTFEDALEAVSSGRAGLAMIPVDNSIAGRVADIHPLLPEPGLHIGGEYFLPIHFQLLGVPGASLDQIRTVRSHVHALGQCRKIIREHGWSTVVADATAGAPPGAAGPGDPAGAARGDAEPGGPPVASLPPRAAAELYGLQTLASDVEDEHHNTTRF